MIIDDSSSTVLSFIYPQLVISRASDHNQEVRVYKFTGKYFVSVDNLTQSGGLLTKIWDQAIAQVDSTFYASVCPTKALILGLGAGSAVGSLRKTWPDVHLTAVEIDPVMVEIGKSYFDLESVSDLDIIEEDAFIWLEKVTETFDVLLVDLYVGRKVPPKAEEAVFVETIRRRLSTGGVALFNRLVLKENQQSTEVFVGLLQNTFRIVQLLKTPANKVYVVRK